MSPPESSIWKIIVWKTWKLTSLLYLQLQTLNTWVTTHNQCHCFIQCIARNTQTKKWFHITFHTCLSRKNACLNIKWNSFLNMEIKCHWNFSLAHRAQFWSEICTWANLLNSRYLQRCLFFLNMKWRCTQETDFVYSNELKIFHRILMSTTGPSLPQNQLCTYWHLNLHHTKFRSALLILNVIPSTAAFQKSCH